MTALFLSAKWQYLAMINYEIDPLVLKPFIPAGTQLDLWEGKALISLVGFMFLNTRVYGFSVPFHKNFEEINLRFYIKSNDPSQEVRRGVAFIREIVPRRGIACVANFVYNEKYVALPMKHQIKQSSTNISVDYGWKFQDKWQEFGLSCNGSPTIPLPGSEAEFITEHYWGYSSQHNGQTMEYQVQHPPWRVWTADHYEVSVDMKSFYGDSFASFLEKPPTSAFLAEGSEVQVYKGTIRRG